MKNRKPLTWIGSSKKDLLDFPKEVQRTMGYAINLAQQGKKDEDTKPFKGYGGCSVLEIVKEDVSGTFRTIYTVKFEEAIYILHAFQKKSTIGKKTPKQDVELIDKRFQEAKRQHEMLKKKKEV